MGFIKTKLKSEEKENRAFYLPKTAPPLWVDARHHLLRKVESQPCLCALFIVPNLEQSSHFLPKSRILFHQWNNRGHSKAATSKNTIFKGLGFNNKVQQMNAVGSREHRMHLL
jgi:hypothetical protein